MTAVTFAMPVRWIGKWVIIISYVVCEKCLHTFVLTFWKAMLLAGTKGRNNGIL